MNPKSTALTVDRHKPDPLRLHRTVNTRFLGFLIFAATTLAVGLHLLHGFQIKRNAADLQVRAERAYKDENFEQAILLQSLYLGFRPNDLDALTRLGQWTDETANSRRGWLSAFLTLEQVLAQDRERHDVRKRVVELAFKLRRFSDALVRLNELPDRTSTVAFKIGRSLEGLGRINDASNAYIEAVQKDGTSVDAYASLISLIDRRADELDLRRIEREFSPKRASAQKGAGDQPVRPDPESVVTKITERMLSLVKPPFRARLAAATHLKVKHQHPAARNHLEVALGEAPDEVDVILAVAELALAQADFSRFAGEHDDATRYLKEAEVFANRAANRDEPELRAFLMLARIASQANRFDEAERHIRRGLEAVAKLKKISADKKDPGLLIEWRIAEREIILKWSLADILITEFQLQSQEGVDAHMPREIVDLIDSLRRMNALPGLIGFLEARQQMGLKKWHIAASRLAAARADLRNLPDAIKRATLFLAQCYLALEQPDARVLVFRQAVEEDPFWAPGRLGFAAALMGVNRIDEAITQYSTVMSAPGVAATVARLMIMQQLSLPESRRQWRNVEVTLERANRLDPDAPEIVALRSEVMAFQRKYDEAKQLLETSRDGRPDQIEFWTALASLELRRSDVDEQSRRRAAAEIVAAAEQRFGDRVELRLSRMQLLRQDKTMTEERSAALQLLVEDSDQFSTNERVTLLRGLAQAYGAASAWGEARKTWDRCSVLRPDDLEIHLIRGQLAIMDGDFKAVESIVRVMRDVEGPDGPNANYLEATSIVEKERLAEKPNVKMVEQARDQLRRAEKRRPYWAALPHSIGVAEQILGRKDDAFTQFRKAIALGDASREVLSSVVQYLYEKGRFDEADQELRQLSDTNEEALTDDLKRMASRIAFQRQRVGDALGFVKQVDSKARSSSDLIWESWLNFAQGQRGPEVEDPLRQAVKQAPESAQAWFALTAYLVRVDRLKEAADVVREAGERLPESPKELRPLTVARCYELLDDVENAETNYLAAANIDPASVPMAVVLIEFYARRREFKKAEDRLEKLLTDHPNMSTRSRDATRRARAQIAAARGGFSGRTRALDMLEQTGSAETALSVENLRTQATILANSQTRSDKLKLIGILQEISLHGKLSPYESYQLARLHEQTGNWKESKRLLERLVHDEPAEPAYLGQMALGSMRNNDVDSAETWLKRLRTLVPRSTAIVKLEVYLLNAQRKSRDAVARIQEFQKQDVAGLSTDDIIRDLTWQMQLGEFTEMLKAHLRKANDTAGERTIEQTRRLAQSGELPLAIAILRERIPQERVLAVTTRFRQRVAARLYEDVGRMADAEQIWRSLVETADAPEEVFLLVSNLARQDRLDDALQLCEQAWSTCRPEIVVAGSVAALQAAPRTPEQIARVAARVEPAVETARDSAPMLLHLGDLRNLQERYPEAVKIYQAVLKKNPDSTFALNNLAWLLAVYERQGAEALALIDRAIALEGPTAELLDTRATVYVALNQPSKAIADLKTSIEDSPSPMKYFHLAQAYRASGQNSAARDAVSSSQNLKERSVHPLERDSLRELRAQFQ